MTACDCTDPDCQRSRAFLAEVEELEAIFALPPHVALQCEAPRWRLLGEHRCQHDATHALHRTCSQHGTRDMQLVCGEHLDALNTLLARDLTLRAACGGTLTVEVSAL